MEYTTMCCMNLALMFGNQTLGQPPGCVPSLDSHFCSEPLLITTDCKNTHWLYCENDWIWTDGLVSAVRLDYTVCVCVCVCQLDIPGRLKLPVSPKNQQWLQHCWLLLLYQTHSHTHAHHCGFYLIFCRKPSLCAPVIVTCGDNKQQIISVLPAKRRQQNRLHVKRLHLSVCGS